MAVVVVCPSLWPTKRTLTDTEDTLYSGEVVLPIWHWQYNTQCDLVYRRARMSTRRTRRGSSGWCTAAAAGWGCWKTAHELNICIRKGGKGIDGR